MLVRAVHQKGWDMSENRLIWFHGRECPHCRQLRPVVERLEKDNGLTITQLEVWHDEENADLMRSYAQVITPACGGELGVPAFYNEVTGKAICGGRITAEQLLEWAKG